jgi:tRNA(fMet)-specific endonuclease VapC
MEGRSRPLIERIHAAPRTDLGIPAIAVAELRYGAEKSGRVEENQRRLDTFLAPLQVFSFEEKAAQHYGGLRFNLRRLGRLIGPMDMLIAATALANDAILITHNTDEFSRIPGLRYEDWTIPI